ncbi:erythrocyte membrane antigen 1 [Plasmodium chabaudi adami]|uniref:Erythrocyte membrane antigen 1 n=1 Tax=Plasmodium chabaudi adami TaxID=5826 RepID=A0A1C6WJ88_PLACE|nr:erythrocyte membrane antigen 1 [Plasmodium chabaudi adami]
MSYNLDLPNLNFIDEFSPIIVEIPKARQTKLTESFISETNGTIIDKVTGFVRRENESVRKGWYIRSYKEAYEHMIKFIFTPFNKNDQSFKSNQTNVHKQGDTLPGVSKAPEKHKLPEEQKLSTINEENPSTLHENTKELDEDNENKSEEINNENKGEAKDEEIDEELDAAYLRALSYLNDDEDDNSSFKEGLEKIYRALKVIRRNRRRNQRRNEGNINERKGNEELDGEDVKAAPLLGDEDNENKGEEINNENKGEEINNENKGEEINNENKGEEINNENKGDTLPGVSKAPEKHKLPEEQKLSTINEENPSTLHENTKELDEDNENKSEEINNENKGEAKDEEIDEELDAAYLRALSYLNDDEDDNSSFKEGLEKIYRALKVIRRNRRRNQRRNEGNINERKGNEELDGEDVKAAPLLGDEDNENKE